MPARFDRSFRIKSPTGASLAARHEAPAGKTRAILMINHGLSEHSGRYRAFAQNMAARGLAVFAHDHRGHGETRADDALPGRFARRDGWRAAIADAKAVRDEAVNRYPGLPVILFGHSMGGLLTLNCAISNPNAYDAIAVWNANFNAGAMGRAGQAVLAIERWMKGSDVSSPLLDRLTFESWGRAIANRKTLHDWLSHDEAQVRAYIDDPLCGTDPTVSLWSDVFTLIYRGANPSNWSGLDKTMPINLMGGGEDPSTEKGRAVLWLADRLRAAGFSDVTLTIEERFRHETLNEIGAERAIANFATWVDRVIAR